MALATMKEVLEFAERKKSAIPAFTVDTLETAEVVAEAAEAHDYPVMMMIGQNTFKYNKLRTVSQICRTLAEQTKVPIVLHLDHGASFEQTIQCIREGFTSVMFDGSRLPLEKNIEITNQVVAAAKAVGISVEAELGAIGGTEDGMTANVNLVNVDDARIFVERTDVDALAIGIGNAHGIYKSTPNLAFDRLEQVAALGAPPLVLHGGSGIPDEMIRKAILLGIRKINVATEVRHAFIEGLAAAADTKDIYKVYASGKKASREIVDSKIALFYTTQ